MAKYYNTTDDSIGAVEIKEGVLVVARKIDNRTIIEIVEDAEQIASLIDKIAPVLQKIIQAIKDFFFNIIQRMPSTIIVDGNVYNYTIQPAPFKAIDRVFYMSELDGDRIFEYEHKHIGKAKRMLIQALKSEGYIK